MLRSETLLLAVLIPVSSTASRAASHSRCADRYRITRSDVESKLSRVAPCTANFAGSPPATTPIVASISRNCAISSLVIAVLSWSRCSSLRVFPAAIRLVINEVTRATTRLSRAAMRVILNSLPRPQFNTFVLADNFLPSCWSAAFVELSGVLIYSSTPPSRSLCLAHTPTTSLGQLLVLSNLAFLQRARSTGTTVAKRGGCWRDLTPIDVAPSSGSRRRRRGDWREDRRRGPGGNAALCQGGG